MTSCQKISTFLLIFRFIANLEISQSCIPDAWSMILIFFNNNLLPNKRYKKKLNYIQLQLAYYGFEKRYYFVKNCDFLQKILTPATYREVMTR